MLPPYNLKSMTQEEFNEIVNTAAMHTSEDNSNDFYTILEEMIEDEEEEMIEDEMEKGSFIVTFVNKW